MTGRGMRCLALLGLAGMLGLSAACGKQPMDKPAGLESEMVPDSGREESPGGEGFDGREESSGGEGITGREGAQPDWMQDDLKRRFGQNCISRQTFEVELSEYEGKVWFVPFAPGEGQPELKIQVMREQEVLAELKGYVPQKLAREKFVSLDAVSFYDVNYDGYTDIVLIETYGNTSFAAVYYGFDSREEYLPYFSLERKLSEALSAQAESLTIPGIRKLLAEGRKNGEFADYREGYRAVIRLWELEGYDGETYDLLYVDGDEIPELAAGHTGYYVSLYTYHDGKVYTLMDRWGYGAMGNGGYEYAPGRNNLRNYNADQAGAIMNTYYMAIGEDHWLEVVAGIVTYNFDDANGNGWLDESEMGSLGNYGVSYLGGEEISDVDWDAYDAGDDQYEMIYGVLSREELLEKLIQTQ